MPSRGSAVPQAVAGAEGIGQSLPAYRIEHRRGDAAVVLGRTDDPLAQHSVLAPLAVQLVDAGATGVLLLIEEASGDVLARRALHPDGDGRRRGALTPAAALSHDAAAAAGP